MGERRGRSVVQHEVGEADHDRRHQGRPRGRLRLGKDGRTPTRASQAARGGAAGRRPPLGQRRRRRLAPQRTVSGRDRRHRGTSPRQTEGRAQRRGRPAASTYAVARPLSRGNADDPAGRRRRRSDRGCRPARDGPPAARPRRAPGPARALAPAGGPIRDRPSTSIRNRASFSRLVRQRPREPTRPATRSAGLSAVPACDRSSTPAHRFTTWRSTREVTSSRPLSRTAASAPGTSKPDEQRQRAASEALRWRA